MDSTCSVESSLYADTIKLNITVGGYNYMLSSKCASLTIKDGEGFGQTVWIAHVLLSLHCTLIL